MTDDESHWHTDWLFKAPMADADVSSWSVEQVGAWLTSTGYEKEKKEICHALL